MSIDPLEPLKKDFGRIKRSLGFSDSIVHDVVYHGTNKEFNEISVGPDGGIHVGTYAQAKMRSLGTGQKVIGFHINVRRIKTVKDTGGNWKPTIKAAKKQGYDGIRYLNRYEGMTTENVIKNQGKDLDVVSDADFKTLFPEAEYSYIVFKPNQLVNV